MEKFAPLEDLRVHAEGKLAEEERYHANMAKAGKKITRNRIDRRPLWVAAIHLAEVFATRSTTARNAGLTCRQDAWEWLCRTSCHMTAEANQFEAVIEFSKILHLPTDEAKAVLAERAQVRAAREEAARRARAAQLRAELDRLEGRSPVAPVPAALPENVIPFARRAVNA